MLSKAIKFAGVLKNGDKPANYLFICDLNTLGLNYYFDRDIPAHAELRKSDIYASRYYDMIRLQKNISKHGTMFPFLPIHHPTWTIAMHQNT
ncbi:MAG: hypothetical protein K9G58_12010 [Bacteroidales bacterium]|nr:hypothetical protein [Bacteroidales bacterium]MCF8388131.1 hypothetical protein [Bacteroidales bacterium]MCF8398889.1 hypothetical protein [Bacteroidales bacterium]